jgi:hypothetical protein
MGALRLYSVFVIIAAGLLRQNMFVITEYHAVTWIGKGTSLLDELQGSPRFWRQLCDSDG